MKRTYYDTVDVDTYSVEIESEFSQQNGFSKDYEGEWKISKPDSNSFHSILTRPFSPLLDNSVHFCFETWFQKINHRSQHIATDMFLFKLKLKKLSSVSISPALFIKINVKVNYSDGSLFHDYSEIESRSVKDMKDFTFTDVVKQVEGRECKKILQNSFIINCKMTFYGDQHSSHFMFGVETSSSEKYFELIKHLKPMYDPSIFSDFVFRIDDKSLAAHRVILAAHSPVFKNMLTHEFQESKTNSVTITDASFEIFDLFLRYLYSGEIEDKSWDTLRELYYLDDKYDVGILKNECIEGAISLLSVELICDVLKTADSFSDSRLKTAANRFAVQHLKEIVLREDWKELQSTHPMTVYEITSEFITK